MRSHSPLSFVPLLLSVICKLRNKESLNPAKCLDVDDKIYRMMNEMRIKSNRSDADRQIVIIKLMTVNSFAIGKFL